MKASLDTNAIIHFYKAGLQNIIFDFFEDGVFIYEQIRNVELKHHGQDVLVTIDADIASGKIEVYTDQKLKELAVFDIFDYNVKENRQLYGAGDLGEVYAISLAQTIGAYCLVTDDIKQGGPYMSLLQFYDYDVIPFTFAEILLLRYLAGTADEKQTIKDFDSINNASHLNWAFSSQISKFIKRFWKEPYQEQDKLWMKKFVTIHKIKSKTKFTILISELQNGFQKSDI